VLSDREVGRALERGSGGDSQNLPRYISLNALNRFIDADLSARLKNPLRFVHPNGLIANGLPAEDFPKVCDVWLKARDAEELKEEAHLLTAKKAEILMRGLAQVGIIALVDEATGYTKQKDEYQKIWRLSLES
jgi:hypothetical protein